MKVFLLEWQMTRLDGSNSEWIVDGVFDNESLAFEASNAGTEIGSTPFAFKAESDFCGDRRWISNLVDSERFRVREFRVETVK